MYLVLIPEEPRDPFSPSVPRFHLPEPHHTPQGYVMAVFLDSEDEFPHELRSEQHAIIIVPIGITLFAVLGAML